MSPNTKPPVWPDPNTEIGAQFFGRARQIVARYKAKGFGAAFAFGMLAQAEAESSLDPNEVGDWIDEAGARLPWKAHKSDYPAGSKATSFGLHQRKSVRTCAIRDGKIKRGKVVVAGLGIDIAADALAGKNTIEREVEATIWELENYSDYGFDVIKAQKSAYGVAYQATVSFERAGTVADGAAIRRGIMAETWVELASGIWPKSRGPAPKNWQALTEGW